MDSKYSNIFWHQGVKLFEEESLNDEKMQARVRHLENDVTKALLNVFEHGSKKLLGAFLRLIDVKQAPETFEFDFQITDTHKFRRKNNRIMLSIISADTPQKSDPNYGAERSQPDACIFNRDTAILIEAKTQSPLIAEQVESHIKHFWGTETSRRILTWEDLSEQLNSAKSVNALDAFLLSQFTQFLSLIGLAEFKGFLKSDFAKLGMIGKISEEEYLDFKRLLHRKIEKAMKRLDGQIKPAFQFKNYAYRVSRVHPKSPVIWSAFYFRDDEKTHVNEYPSINFAYGENGLQLALNAETQPSVEKFISFIKENPNELDKLAKKLSGFYFLLQYKYHYFPQNQFIWNFVPGYPKEMPTFKAEAALSTMMNFERNWHDYANTLLFEMKNGVRKHSSGQPFSEKELKFAQSRNPNPHYVIRIAKRYSSDDVEKLKDGIVTFLKDEVLKLRKLVECVVK